MSTALLPRNLLFGSAAAVGSIAALFAACTDSYQPPAMGTGGSSSTTASHGGGGGLTLMDSGPMCPLTCSNDLKSVVDCKGVVQTACTVDQGCANGACIADPCAAATVSKSSYGCDYYALKTVQRPQADGACFVAFIANTWGLPVHLTITRGPVSDGGVAEDGGTVFDPSAFTILGSNLTAPYTHYDDSAGIPVGDVALVFLSRLSNGSVVNCPIAAALGTETGVPIDLLGDTGNGVGQAFHITTDYPVVAYQMTPYGGGQAGVTSATLLLPTSAWDTNYIAVNGYATAVPNEPAGNPSLDILAYLDNTQVTLLPNVDVVGNGDGGVPAAAPANKPVMYTLNAGQFLQITQSAELTGSPIQANNPIAVFGAHSCMDVPFGQPLCDSAQQQLPPVHALGHEYVAVRYRGRGADTDGGVPDGGSDEAVPWRLVGAVAGTTLTWTPSMPPGAMDTVGVGGVIEFTAPGPFVVSSQDANHPFYLGAYMTGGGDPPPSPSGFAGEGDPDWVNVITPAQFLTNYVFFTDQTYPETNLVLVRNPSKVDGSFADVTLNCAGSGNAGQGHRLAGDRRATSTPASTSPPATSRASTAAPTAGKSCPPRCRSASPCGAGGTPRARRRTCPTRTPRAPASSRSTTSSSPRPSRERERIRCSPLPAILGNAPERSPTACGRRPRRWRSPS